MSTLLRYTDKGLYCEAAGVFIDPWRSVDKALITHGHSDHARRGHRSYISHKHTLPILQHRLGNIHAAGVEYGEKLCINGVDFSFHPAGHIPGSAQIRVEHRGEVWVVSGDYKPGSDGLSAAFEPVRCHTFITESTFALPVFRWQKEEQIFEEIKQWWTQNRQQGITSVVGGYALGKAQHLAKGTANGPGRVYVHPAVGSINELMRQHGIDLPQTAVAAPGIPSGSLLIVPPSELGGDWLQQFRPFSAAMASGWMALNGIRRRRSSDRGFVLSDHADWDGLNLAVEATGAQTVIVTHGYADAFVRWLTEKGIHAMTDKIFSLTEKKEGG